ncbi:MAG: D-alanyl-D-alanine carboxypeptidase, partial [Nitrososphaeraceae archaeon]|nr:D-alanyl-D-alanine carboxypeptidase [Nitrososphaeraceae archaeon]
IHSVISQDQLLRSHWGIFAQNLETEEILYQLNEDKYFVPASNIKLITSAAALFTLGKDFQIRTSFYATGSSPNLESLTIVGRGDPTLTTEHLQKMVQQLKISGVEQINQLIDC